MAFPEPCPSNCEHPTADDACETFVSQGFGPEGDWEHSFFCRTCGYERADHSTLRPSGCASLSADGEATGQACDCDERHDLAYCDEETR